MRTHIELLVCLSILIYLAFAWFAEQFVDAETDYLKCLELQEKHLEPDDRLIAETYPDPITLN